MNLRPFTCLLLGLTASCTRVPPPPTSNQGPGAQAPPVAAATAKANTLPASPAAAIGPATGTTAAFPGAEGFGARAKGGRGGRVCIVTSRAKSGAGSLAECLSASGPRTVVFQVGGVIEGPLEIRHGALTIAGESAPGPVTVRGGVVCDNVYDPNDCNDVIVRHVRFRGGAPDSFRIGGAHDVILDHCSFAGAEDENIEITRSRDITVQRSVIAEPVGDHYQWGGVLINYSKDVMPLDRISIHHTVFNGVSGRLPEMSCEENTDGPGKSNCTGHVLHIELTNNVLWDAFDPVWYNRCTGNNAGNDCAPSAPGFSVALNADSNVIARRKTAGADALLFEPHLLTAPGNRVFHRANRILTGTAGQDFAGPSIPARHAFPSITVGRVETLVSDLARTSGAFPRDAMDTRLAGYLNASVDSRPPSWAKGVGIDRGDAFAASSAAPPAADADQDGMPDTWEAAHGGRPGTPDAAAAGQCGGGYTLIECWLHERAAALVPK